MRRAGHGRRCELPPLFDGRASRGARDSLACRLRAANTAAATLYKGLGFGEVYRYALYVQKPGMLSRLSAKKILLGACMCLDRLPDGEVVLGGNGRARSCPDSGSFPGGKWSRVKTPEAALIRERSCEGNRDHHQGSFGLAPPDIRQFHDYDAVSLLLHAALCLPPILKGDARGSLKVRR